MFLCLDTKYPQSTIAAIIASNTTIPNTIAAWKASPTKYTTNEITYEPTNQNASVLGNAFLLDSAFIVAIAAKHGNVNKL